MVAKQHRLKAKRDCALSGSTLQQPAVWSHDIVERDGRGIRRDPVAIDTDYNVVAVGKPFYFILFYYLLV